MIIVAVLMSLSVFAVVMLKFVTPRFHVPTGSMRPTIHERDHVFVNRLAYKLGAKPKAGEVVAFREGRTKFIYRVVGVPGDRVEMRDNVLTVNGERRHEPYVILEPDIPAMRTFGPLTVPPRSYFLGDNRDNANDSRFRGFIREDQLLGRVLYVLHIGRYDE